VRYNRFNTILPKFGYHMVMITKRWRFSRTLGFNQSQRKHEVTIRARCILFV